MPPKESQPTKDAVRRLEKKLESSIVNRPLTSLAAALGFGFVASLALLPRPERSKQ